MVWSVKYRRKIITPKIEERIKIISEEVAKKKGFIIQLCEAGEQDHLHYFVSAPPKLSPSYIVKMLKGITARKLFIEFPEIKNQLWNGVMWNHSYYIETIGSISEDVIRKYIEKQTKAY